MSSKKIINVLFLAAEADPLIKVGGLGDVAGSLPRALRELAPDLLDGYSLDVRLALPLHATIRQKVLKSHPMGNFSIKVKGMPLPFMAIPTELFGVPTYLISGDLIPPDGPVYSSDPRQDGRKYFFYCMAALELIHQMGWQTDILHANDWHTAAAVYALALSRDNDTFLAATRSLMTIHNLPFMGVGSEEVLNDFNLPPSSDARIPGWARHTPLPLGLVSADHIVAVSPGYAREILTPDYGCGLELLLYDRKNDVTGIINGLDTKRWNPATDQALLAQYSWEDLSRRQINKQSLLAEFSLNPAPDIPLIILVSRMDPQKGVDLVSPALNSISDLPWQAILLGTGDPFLEESIHHLQDDFPDRIRAVLRFDTNLSRRLYSGADLLIMPSRYEPCGLSQMIAMHYGCIPVARSTGGLKDTICDDPEQRKTTGFLFNEPTHIGLANALRRALDIYTRPIIWRDIQHRGMVQDFSWHQSALAYANLYLDLHKRKI